MDATFTGTQQGMTDKQKQTLRNMLVGVETLRHGDCIGSDAECHAIALEFNKTYEGIEKINIEIHPANIPGKRAYCKGANKVHPAKDPIARNHDMVNLTEWTIATPKTNQEELRSGTWATIRYSRNKENFISIIWPDGSVSVEND